MATDDAAMKSMAAQILGNKTAQPEDEPPKALSKKEKRQLKIAKQQ